FAEGLVDQFWVDILRVLHPPEDVYKIALYTQAEAVDKNLASTTYDTVGELESKGGYTQGGQTLTGRTVARSGTTTYLDFDDPVWQKASLTADAAVIYNASKEDRILKI